MGAATSLRCRREALRRGGAGPSRRASDADDRAGRDPGADWPFYLAFSFFRYAAIVQGVYARALQGNASSATAEQLSEIPGIGAKTT